MRTILYKYKTKESLNRMELIQLIKRSYIQDWLKYYNSQQNTLQYEKFEGSNEMGGAE